MKMHPFIKILFKWSLDQFIPKIFILEQQMVKIKAKKTSHGLINLETYTSRVNRMEARC